MHCKSDELGLASDQRWISCDLGLEVGVVSSKWKHLSIIRLSSWESQCAEDSAETSRIDWHQACREMCLMLQQQLQGMRTTTHCAVEHPSQPSSTSVLGCLEAANKEMKHSQVDRDQGEEALLKQTKTRRQHDFSKHMKALRRGLDHRFSHHQAIRKPEHRRRRHDPPQEQE